MKWSKHLKPFCTKTTRQGFQGMDCNDFPPTVFSSVTGTSITALWTSIWTGIAANDPRTGKVYYCAFGGIYTTSSAATTLILTPSYGTSATQTSDVTLATSATATIPASITNGPFYGELYVGFRSVGLAPSSGSVWCSGVASFGGPSGFTGSAIAIPFSSTSAVTVDNTTAQGIIMFMTSSVAQTYTCEWVTLQSLN